MLRLTRVLRSGLDFYKFKGPKWSQTRQRNHVKRIKQERSVLECLQHAKEVETEFQAGKRDHPGFLHVQLRRSPIGRTPDNRKMLQVLNLSRINAIVERFNSAATRTVISAVRHLVNCEHVEKAVFPERNNKLAKSKGYQVVKD